MIRADCTKWLGELDATIPTVIIRAVDSAGKDLVDVKVTIDGAPLVTKLDGRGVAVDPGVHAMRYEAPGHEPLSESIVVRETEKNRLVNVTLKDIVQKPVVVAPPPPPPSQTTKIPPLAFVLGGAGLAVIGGGVVFWVLGSGERGDLRDGCAKTASCKQDDVDAARTKMIVGDVLVGVGVVAVAAGVYVALTSSKKASANAGVVPLSSGAGLGVNGSF